jgi:hypothetical protein
MDGRVIENSVKQAAFAFGLPCGLYSIVHSGSAEQAVSI